MPKKRSLYHGHRFPAVVISQSVRWYFRFQLSLRDIEELLFERGLVVSCETIRRWCDKFGASFAYGAKAARRKPGSTWHLDEMFVTLRGERDGQRLASHPSAASSSSCRRRVERRHGAGRFETTSEAHVLVLLDLTRIGTWLGRAYGIASLRRGSRAADQNAQQNCTQHLFHELSHQCLTAALGGPAAIAWLAGVDGRKHAATVRRAAAAAAAAGLVQR